VRSFYVWNEAKGFFYSDTPHAWAVDDYVRLYNALVDVILDTAGVAGVPSSEIRIGGPYVPVRVQTVTNASSLPAGHPLNGPWGGVKQEAIRFLERFVTQAKRLDMLVIDMGLGLTEGESWVDEFENCTRIPVIIDYVRDVARAAGWDVPVELAELYLEPQDPANTNRQLRAALAAEALRCLVEAGVGAAFVWGFRHGGQSAILTATDTPDGGAPMPVWEVCRIFSENFCRGQRIHRLAIQGKGVGAIANDRDVLLINHTRGPLTVELCGAVHELNAYERRLAPCAAV
jgi:hypothetical protein